MIYIWIAVALVASILLGWLLEHLLNSLLQKQLKFWQGILLIVFIFICLLIAVFSTGMINRGTSAVETTAPECKFIDEIRIQQKAEIKHWIDTPAGSGYWTGVQVVTNTKLTIPEGWIAHFGNNDDRLGPLTISEDTLASIYAPYKCRPLER